MEAPTRGLSPNAFFSAVEAHEEAHYEKKGDGYVCKKCGSEILQETCYVSLHDARFGGKCAGSGEVKQIPLPFCPKCEGRPKRTHTCTH